MKQHTRGEPVNQGASFVPDTDVLSTSGFCVPTFTRESKMQYEYDEDYPTKLHEYDFHKCQTKYRDLKLIDILGEQ